MIVLCYNTEAFIFLWWRTIGAETPIPILLYCGISKILWNFHFIGSEPSIPILQYWGISRILWNFHFIGSEHPIPILLYWGIWFPGFYGISINFTRLVYYNMYATYDITLYNTCFPMLCQNPPLTYYYCVKIKIKLPSFI